MASNPATGTQATTAGPTFQVTRHDDCLQLRGQLVLATAAQALERLVAILPRDCASLVADLGDLTNSDSAGLAALVQWRAEAFRQGTPLRLVRAPEGLRALARLADLEAELLS